MLQTFIEEQSVHNVYKLNTVLLWRLLTYLAMQGLFLVPEKYSPTLLCRYVGVVVNSVVETDHQTLHCFVTFVILIYFVSHFIGLSSILCSCLSVGDKLLRAILCSTLVHNDKNTTHMSSSYRRLLV